MKFQDIQDYGTEVDQSLPRHGGGSEKECKGAQRIFGGDRSVSELDFSYNYMLVYTYQNSFNCVFKIYGFYCI